MPRRYFEGEQVLISNLLAYFQKERDAGKPLLPVTGVGISTVKMFNAHGIKNDEDYKAATTAAIQRSRGNPLYRVHEHIIRNRIYSMFAAGEHVTIVSLQTNLLGINGLEISTASLCKALKVLKFIWRKDSTSNRKYLMEQPFVVERRVRFLTYMDNFNSSFNLKPVFLDETLIYSKGAFRNSWQDDSIKTVKKKSSEGVRYIILHAGSERGFVANASLIFKSGSKSGDYREYNLNNIVSQRQKSTNVTLDVNFVFVICRRVKKCLKFTWRTKFQLGWELWPNIS